jgi:predicted  nucleic acid-binding Zn-ribbon protein
MKKLEGFEKKIEELEIKDQNKENQLLNFQKTLNSFNERLSTIESRINPENPIKNLESLNFSSKSPVNEKKVANIETSVKKLFSKIRNIEERSKEPIEKTLINKFAFFEDRLSQIEKVSGSLSGFNKNVRETVKKVKKIENILNSPFTPNHKKDLEYSSPSQSKEFNKSGAEYESVLIGALMDRANFSLKSSPDRPMSALSLHSSFTRAPSSDLKESLRRRGVVLNKFK